ncbi:phage tail protein [Streptomyces sp. NPDC048636]|uniref:phage tail protein n=1 Tax=Streptomyces sp. NPDC048636 TaxID=3155762 RepID=UPI00342DFACB
MSLDQSAPQAISAASFVVTFDGAAPAYFSELGGITTEVEPAEYIATNAMTGAIVHTKQFGKTKPPTVTLKRGVDGSATIWAMHEAVRMGRPAARMGADLKLMGAGESTPRMFYRLHGAWPSKIEVTNLKAGSSEVVLESVTFTCERIQQMPIG